ncbi:MAG: tetratricopeptide repeat protein [Candidatus Melainabacteria bacterium]|nr:tetratricopeptide repeat protein [Candidatus Melainabacteria bacterium]
MRFLLSLLFCFLISGFYVLAEVETPETLSEILQIRSENALLIIDVAKKYPDINFLKEENPDKIVIELLNSKYHDSFKFDDFVREQVLSMLSFVSDISVSDSANQKILVELNLKPGQKFLPKLASKKDNAVKILLLPADVVITLRAAELYNRAVKEQKAKNLERAEELYKEVISLDSSLFLARFNLAAIYLDTAKYDEAISILNGLVNDIEKQPGSEPDKKENLIFVHNGLGIIYYVKGDLENSTSEFQQILKLAPEFHEAFYHIGLVYEKKKDLKLARKNFQRAVDLDKKLADAYYHLGMIDVIEKHKKSAKSNFKKVLELAPETALASLCKQELEKL